MTEPFANMPGIEHFSIPNLEDTIISQYDYKRWELLFKQLARMVVHITLQKEYRLSGNIDMAIEHQKKVDDIYKTLPKEIRW